MQNLKIHKINMMHSMCYFWSSLFLVVSSLNGKIANGLSSTLALGKVGLASPPVRPSHLFSQNADAPDDINADDVNNANDFEGQASKISQPTKADLYGDDELKGLLDLHQQLQSAMKPPHEPIVPATTQSIESPNDLFAGGLHDFILQTVHEIEDETGEDEPPQEKSWISDEAQDRISKLEIIAVASDVDGTIYGFDQKIHPRTRDSIKAAQDSSRLKWIFPATGKTRWGARNSLGPELATLTQGPGVYVQVRTAIR